MNHYKMYEQILARVQTRDIISLTLVTIASSASLILFFLNPITPSTENQMNESVPINMSFF